MEAAIYYGQRDIRIEEVAQPVPLENELLLQVMVAGICGTDAHEYSAGPFSSTQLKNAMRSQGTLARSYRAMSL